MISFHFWYCVLTEEKGVDLGQKKDSYFDNCCHNWPITGKTAVSYDLFWDDLEALCLLYSSEHQLKCFCFFFCAVKYVEKTKKMKDSSFSCGQEHFLDLRMLTKANINSAWQSILPKKKRCQVSFRDRCHCMEMTLPMFTNNAFEWFITFYNFNFHFKDLLRIVMFTPFIYHTVPMYEQFSCVHLH